MPSQPELLEVHGDLSHHDQRPRLENITPRTLLRPGVGGQGTGGLEDVALATRSALGVPVRWAQCSSPPVPTPSPRPRPLWLVAHLPLPVHSPRPLPWSWTQQGTRMKGAQGPPLSYSHEDLFPKYTYS